jgi:hypothetical protein
MVVLSSANQLYNISPLENLEKGKITTFNDSNLADIFDLKDFDILKFDVLDCKSRLLLYLKPFEIKNRIKFERIAILDLDLNILDRPLLESSGIESFSTVAPNENGEEIFTIVIKKNKKKYDWNLVLHQLSAENGPVITKKNIVEFNETEDFKEMPKALCYAYKKNQLFMSCNTGDLYLYDINRVSSNDKKSKKPKIELELKKTFEFIEKEKFFLDNYFQKLILNWDQNYLIGLTKFSEIQILEYKSDNLKCVKTIKPHSTINEIIMSSNGRYLMTCGFFFDSVQRFDLSTLDDKSFGENCENYFKRISDNATEERRDLAKGQTVISTKNYTLKHGDVNQIIHFFKTKNKKITRILKEIQNKDDKRMIMDHKKKINVEEGECQSDSDDDIFGDIEEED